MFSETRPRKRHTGTKNEEEPKWYQYRPCTNSYVKISIVNICWEKKWCFFTPIYRTKYIIHHSHQVVLHSFRLHSHCLIPFSSYKRTTVCNTSGRRIWGNFSSCLNTIGICRPTFAGFCDTRSTSLQSGPLHLSPDQAEISEPAEPVVPCPALDGFSASLVSGSGTGLH